MSRHRIAPTRVLLLAIIVAMAQLALSAAETEVTPAAPAAVPAQDEAVIAIRLFNGLEYEGLVQKTSTEKDLTLLTIYGPLTFARTDIVRTRKELSDSEQTQIRVALRDADAHRRLMQERSERSENPVSRESRSASLPAARESRTELSAADIHSSQLSGTMGWEERMEMQLNRKITFEMTGESLADAMSFIQTATGLNIIISPKVQVANPTVTLRVQSMDAGTALHWIGKLTDTYAEVRDHAIFITDKPSKESDDAEKTDIMLMAARVGAQIDLPADGGPLTDDDRMRIAKQILEKEMPKIPDFPGPDIGLGVKESGNTPFGAP